MASSLGVDQAQQVQRRLRAKIEDEIEDAQTGNETETVGAYLPIGYIGHGRLMIGHCVNRQTVGCSFGKAEYAETE